MIGRFSDLKAVRRAVVVYVILHTHVRLNLLKHPIDRTLREFGGERVVHLLSSEQKHYCAYVNHILTAI